MKIYWCPNCEEEVEEPIVEEDAQRLEHFGTPCSLLQYTDVCPECGEEVEVLTEER